MRTTRFERTALAGFFVAGWVVFFSVAIAHAQPQFVPPPPPQPAPTFNPSTPYTVPQSPETPVSPGLPSAPPSSVVISPSGSPPSAVARSHRRPVTATATSNVVKTLVVRTFLQSRLPVGECAVHSNPETDATPSGVLVRIDAAAS
jgi:hypothetical protein